MSQRPTALQRISSRGSEQDHGNTSEAGAHSESQSAFWSRRAEDLVADLRTSLDGLSLAEAASRLRSYGPNRLAEERRFQILRLLLRQLRSPLLLILVAGAAFSLAIGEWIDAWLVLVIILGSAALGFVQEYRAVTAVAALRRGIALVSRVLRGGEAKTVAADTLVPGDVVLLAAGNLVPADGLVLNAEDFLVSEAVLTGESLPVEKRPGVVAPDAPPGGRTNAVFFGTSVRSGTATVLVAKTGAGTAYGSIAEALRRREPETEFARGVRLYGNVIVRIMAVMALLVMAVSLLIGRPLIESLLFAAALAIGLSPELLPAIVSLTLSSGARSMARQGVIVRRLEAIDNLGNVDVLCVDKTGTITEGIIALDDVVDPSGRPSAEARHQAFLNSAFETGIENPLDQAIVSAGERDGLTASGFTKIDEIPYDFTRKRLTIVVSPKDRPERHRMIVKGAFDNILGICTTVLRDGSAVPLTPDLREELASFYRKKGGEGFRVLALAQKEADARPTYARSDEAALSFAGFLLFLDPPKSGVERTLQELAALGIRTKIISGDNRYVTAHVAEKVGLDPHSLLTGEDLRGLRDEALWHLAEKTHLFVEVDPQQKERIVRALQRTGHSVAFLGDGINDVPALYAADVGVSVDKAVDVARQTADVVLTKRDLEVLVRGIREGRRTLANTLKYICITTGASFGNMLSMSLATPFLPFLPLTATQVLLNNLLSDLPLMAVAADQVDPEQLSSPQRWRARELWRFVITFGLVSTLFDLVTFAVLVFAFNADQTIFRTAWFEVSLLTEIAVVLILRSRRPALRSRPSRLLLATTIAVTAIAVALPYLPPPLAAAFDFLPLGGLWATVALIVLAYGAVTEGVKLRFFRS